jgi:hypothetical protein
MFLNQIFEGLNKGTESTVTFVIDGERSYEHVMQKFGNYIDWAGDYMTAPRSIFNQIEEIVYSTGGEVEEVTGHELPESWKDTATLLGAPVVAGALAVGAQHFDDQKPHVRVGGQNAMVVQYDSSRIPGNAMVLKGADGKMYRVWQQSGKGMSKMTLAAPAEVKEGILDRFKKKAPEPEMADPGNYPRGRADIDQWMTDTVEYYKVKHPESLFKLFCPSYKDYLPVRVRVGTSEQIMAQHMGTYKQLRDANPEAKKLARQRYTEYEKYPSGPSDDYTNKVAEGADERKHNALWAQITDYEKRQAKAERYGRDTQAQHFKQMADQLRAKLPTSDNPINELSNEKLAQYKTTAAADASASDKRGEYDRGNKRFSGIVKATNKQFANDAKKHR